MKMRCFSEEFVAGTSAVAAREEGQRAEDGHRHEEVPEHTEHLNKRSHGPRAGDSIRTGPLPGEQRSCASADFRPTCLNSLRPQRNSYSMIAKIVSDGVQV